MSSTTDVQAIYEALALQDIADAADLLHPVSWKQYEWSPAFSIQLQWVPVPQVKAAVSGSRDADGKYGISVRE